MPQSELGGFPVCRRAECRDLLYYEPMLKLEERIDADILESLERTCQVSEE